MSRRIGVIGTGHIAAPMVRFLARRGHRIAVSRRSEAVSSTLAAEVGVTVADPQDVLDAADVVLLCLRPQHAEAALAPLSFRADHQILSVMAGVTADQLTTICGPASDFVQYIPLGFLEHGGCPLAAFGNTDLLTDLFVPENPVVPVATESALNAHFAICAMVPGLLDLMQSGASWLGQHTGDARASAFFTSQLMGGFLASMDKDIDGHLSQERDALATEGTLSLQMIEGLRAGNANSVLVETLNAIETRLNGPT